MTPPLVAASRIVLPININGLVHKLRVYARNATLVGTDWMINTRETDANDLAWADAVADLAAAVSFLLPTTASANAAILEKRTGDLWNPVDFVVVPLPNKGGTSVAASQITLVMRDTTFYKVKVVVMEGIIDGPGRYPSFDTLTGALLNMASEWDDTHTLDNAPWRWQVGRDNEYLLDNPFVGLTITFNRKMRRARGLA